MYTPSRHPVVRHCERVSPSPPSPAMFSPKMEVRRDQVRRLMSCPAQQDNNCGVETSEKNIQVGATCIVEPSGHTKCDKRSDYSFYTRKRTNTLSSINRDKAVTVVTPTLVNETSFAYDEMDQPKCVTDGQSFQERLQYLRSSQRKLERVNKISMLRLSPLENTTPKTFNSQVSLSVNGASTETLIVKDRPDLDRRSNSFSNNRSNSCGDSQDYSVKNHLRNYKEWCGIFKPKTLGSSSASYRSPMSKGAPKRYPIYSNDLACSPSHAPALNSDFHGLLPTHQRTHSQQSLPEVELKEFNWNRARSSNLQQASSTTALWFL